MSGDNFEDKWKLEQREITRHYDGLDPGDVRRMKAALEEARHELTTLHGLYAFDGAAPEESWRLDESKVLAKMDEVLG